MAVIFPEAAFEAGVDTSPARNHQVPPGSCFIVDVSDASPTALSIRVGKDAPTVAERAVSFGGGGGVGPAISQYVWASGLLP